MLTCTGNWKKKGKPSGNVNGKKFLALLKRAVGKSRMPASGLLLYCNNMCWFTGV